MSVLVDWVQRILTWFEQGFWGLVALAFDLLHRLGPTVVAAMIGLLVVLAFFTAVLLQRGLVRRITAEPRTVVRLWRLDLGYSGVGLIALPFRLARALFRVLGRLLRRKRKSEEAVAEDLVPYRIATLGPTYLLAGVGSAGLYLVGLASEPLLAARLTLTPGAPAWQILFLGHRPELGAFLPLGQHPWFGLLLTFLFWLIVWSWIGRLIRLFLGDQLGHNLATAGETALPSWPRWFAARTLVEPAVAYRSWATPMVGITLPILVWAYMAIGAMPYRLPASSFSIGVLLWLSWVLHLRLRGAERELSSAEAVVAETAGGSGWPEVLAWLRSQHQIGEPLTFRSPRAVSALESSTGESFLLSPLLRELLAVAPKLELTPMQQTVLCDLSEHGYVHTVPPAADGSFRLGRPSFGLDREEIERQRNRVVVAPEGAGKTTLAVLAAANQTLVHTRACLAVVRDEVRAKALVRAFDRVERSTLRWNLRVRRAGDDLVGDLAQGIVPDVVIADLSTLVRGVLDDASRHADWLRNVGLVVVDDVESFAGPIEAHAQIAFRRLRLFLRELQEVNRLGEESSPLYLVLTGSMSMFVGQWARELCGIKAIERRFGGDKRRRGTDSRDARPDGDENEEETESVAREASDAAHVRQVTAGSHHRFYRLDDFKTPYGEPLDLDTLVAGCEANGVAWCYRPCDDSRRHLGRAVLPQADVIEHATDDPTEAAVVVLEGSFTEVIRELDRLRYAGLRFRRGSRPADTGSEPPPGDEPIALITRIDPDEDMALTIRDRHFDLFTLLKRLPQPIFRPPTSIVSNAHLASDLVQRWCEVADLLLIYGNKIVGCLRQLAANNLLLAEPHPDIGDAVAEYDQLLHVRALAQASGEDEGSPLPPRVSQVELTTEKGVRLIDRTAAVPLDWIDSTSAALRFYPGCIFAGSERRYVVVGTAASESGRRPLIGSLSDLLAEPFLGDEISSPRRRLHIEPSSKPIYEPVHIGDEPLAVALAEIEVEVTHRATLRLDARSGEIRQRHVYDDEIRERFKGMRLQTQGLLLAPNVAGEIQAKAPLHWPAARLVAAAIRLVLPSLYRGGRDQIEVGLFTEDDARVETGQVIRAGEGFVFFDLDDGGNGTVAALHRDGLELTLRLARLVIERVLDYDRLLAFHDHWASEAGALTLEVDPNDDQDKRVQGFRHGRHEAIRHAALAWLDHHLRPEGGPAAAPRERMTGDREIGEGDLFDLGRCWYSEDETVGNLVWVKHRWRLEDGSEAALDAGFDRRVAEIARDLDETHELITGYTALYEAYAADESHRLDDGSVWGSPRGTWHLAAGEDEVESGGQPGDAGILQYHHYCVALATHLEPALRPLAVKLREEAGRSGATSPTEIATYVARFVQGIPYSLPLAMQRGLRPPISTLLYRRGDCDSKSLLLAILLQHCDIPSGLFVSFEESHAVAAAAAPPPLELATHNVAVHRDEEGRFATEEDAAGPPERYARGKEAARAMRRHLETWAEQPRARFPLVWSDLPAHPRHEGEQARVLVPIEATAYSPVGATHFEQPSSWTFLPLLILPRRLYDGTGPVAGDTAEHGEEGTL
ncbi:MAG: hypothetical protein AAGD38_07715 [Acidobacteriota bacterium]